MPLDKQKVGDESLTVRSSTCFNFLFFAFEVLYKADTFYCFLRLFFVQVFSSLSSVSTISTQSVDFPVDLSIDYSSTAAALFFFFHPFLLSCRGEQI